jgi:cytochrome c553
MKRVLLASALLAVSSVVFSQDAAEPKATGDVFTHGDAQAGAAKAASCYACHGPMGNGAINPEWPKLAGQNSSYIYAQLVAFKSQARKQPIMYAQASALSDDDMKNISAFFAAQAPVPGVASKDSIGVAQSLYRAGDAANGIPACAACHGPTGAGNAAAQFPRLSGQNAKYVSNQLHNYQNGNRSQGKAQMMTAIAGKLSDAQIEALASYVSGLQ